MHPETVKAVEAEDEDQVMDFVTLGMFIIGKLCSYSGTLPLSWIHQSCIAVVFWSCRPEGWM